MKEIIIKCIAYDYVANLAHWELKNTLNELIDKNWNGEKKLKRFCIRYLFSL